MTAGTLAGDSPELGRFAGMLISYPVGTFCECLAQLTNVLTCYFPSSRLTEHRFPHCEAGQECHADSLTHLLPGAAQYSCWAPVATSEQQHSSSWRVKCLDRQLYI